MLNNIDISNAMIDIGNYLKDNPNIKAFCQEQFGKELTVIVGATLRRQLPGHDKTPYVHFYNFDKREGVDVEWCRYRGNILVGVGTGANNDFVEDGGVYILDAYDVTTKLMNLIIKELNDYKEKSRPLSTVETEGPDPIEADGSVWAGFLNCTWRVYQSMGRAVNEEF